MKSLITITTCNRLSDVQKYIWDYLRFVNQNSSFHFVLALDGKDLRYIDFCHEYNIPLLYSEEREGVGLSKNRVLQHFPDYECYFFIDDDVELMNCSIFKECIIISKISGASHLCGNEDHLFFKEEAMEDFQLTYSMRGGGYFSFFTKEGVEKVGGWNTLFAKYKRYGHTEHSYRFFNAGLQSAPFIFAKEFFGMILVHNPVSVSKSMIVTNENELIEEEQELINSGSIYFPLKTLSHVYFNDKQLGFNQVVNNFLLKNPQQYPLSERKERRKAKGEYFALRIHPKKYSHFKNFIFVIKSFLYSPMNNELKHALKFYFKRIS